MTRFSKQKRTGTKQPRPRAVSYFSFQTRSNGSTRNEGTREKPVEWSGVEWSGVEWSGVEWSGIITASMVFGVSFK